MSEYVDSIQSIDFVGKGTDNLHIPDSTVVLEVNGEIPTLTSIESSVYLDENIQETMIYTAPQKVIVKKYRLRK